MPTYSPPLRDLKFVLHELLGAADAACYRAKEDGEGAIRLYQGEDSALDLIWLFRWN